MRSLGYRQYTTGYTTLDARFTGNDLPLSCYWKSKPLYCLWPRYLLRISEIDGECWRFLSERERVNLVLRVLSWECPSECTTQETFGNNELCRFHIGQWVRVGVEEPISVNAKWARDTWFAYQNLLQKPFGSSGIHGRVKGKKIIDHRVGGQNVIFCLLTTKTSTVSDRLSLAPNWGNLGLWSGT